jgi:membrane fusion protein (multidrug efflux system)
MSRRRAAATLALAAALLATGCSRGDPTAHETAPAAAPIAVTVVPVSTALVERVADLVGAFFANEEVTVSSQLEARIEWLGRDMGDRVAAGETIVKLDDSDLRAELREIEARLSKARADDARAQALRKEGIMASGEAERMSTDAAVLEAQRDVLRVKLDRAAIRSPLGGSIAARMVSVGEVVQVGHPLFRLVDDDPLKLRTAIPERYAGSLRPGLELRVHVDAYPGRVFTGRISRINPTSETANRSITIEAEVPNPEGLLKPGFFATGDLVYDTAAPVLAVPEGALTTFAGVTKVYVIKDGKAEERVVRTGVAVSEARREIVDGLQAGEHVAVTNLERLEQGAAVSVEGSEPVASARP